MTEPSNVEDAPLTETAPPSTSGPDSYWARHPWTRHAYEMAKEPPPPSPGVDVPPVGTHNVVGDDPVAPAEAGSFWSKRRRKQGAKRARR